MLIKIINTALIHYSVDFVALKDFFSFFNFLSFFKLVNIKNCNKLVLRRLNNNHPYNLNYAVNLNSINKLKILYHKQNVERRNTLEFALKN